MDWNIIAKGTRITNEFAFFLKGVNRCTPISCKVLGELFHMDGKQVQAQCLVHLIDLQWLLFPENIGTHLSIESGIIITS